MYCTQPPTLLPPPSSASLPPYLLHPKHMPRTKTRVKSLLPVISLLARLCPILPLLIFDYCLVPSVVCPTLNVLGATYANCDGRYDVTADRVAWAPERPVYKHERKDR